MLTSANWNGVQCRQLVSEQLAPFLVEEAAKITLEGPPVMLRPEMATSLGLVLHELATNATKYGALSASTGSVALHWRVTNGTRSHRLHIT